MGQTLNHGVYLPAEGERNCYSGLASNWNLLDTAIGDIAGKASATHTHGNITNDGKVGTTANLPLITGTGGAVQAGSFGNQANTFCEGNDSRLSDARTPVAHTHTKSDVTDLFNTDNTYSANQNFKNSGWEQGVTPANLTSLYLQFIDKNNSSFGAIGFHQNSDGYTFLNILAGDKYANGAKSTNGSLIRNQFRMGTTSAGITYQSFDGYWGSSLTPLTNNTYDLGSSSYQWNNLYAKKTYTDMVKAGTGVLTLQSNGTNNSIGIYNGTSAMDGGGFWAYGKDHSNGSVCRIQIYNTSKSRYERVDLANSQFSPTSVELDLGDSTHRWKSFNGINPGALSLPSGGTTENTDWFNVAGSILPAGGNATDFTGGSNYFTPSKDGWLCLVIKNCSYISVWDGSSRMGQSLYAPDTTKNQQIILPVLANHSLDIKVIGSSWNSARLFMPKGNV